MENKKPIWVGIELLKKLQIIKIERNLRSLEEVGRGLVF